MSCVESRKVELTEAENGLVVARDQGWKVEEKGSLKVQTNKQMKTNLTVHRKGRDRPGPMAKNLATFYHSFFFLLGT